MIEEWMVIGLFLFVFPLIAYLIGRYFGGEAAWRHADELARCKMEAGDRIAEREREYFKDALMTERRRAAEYREELARECLLREQHETAFMNPAAPEPVGRESEIQFLTLLRHFEFMTTDRTVQCFYCHESLDSHIALVCRGCEAAAHQRCVVDNDGLCGRYGCENTRRT